MSLDFSPGYLSQVEACGSVPLLPNCGSLPSAWLSPYTHRPLLATAGTRKGLNSQTPFSPPLVSSCFKLILVHFLALNWPKCLVAGLLWERTWDEPDVCKGVCLHICCWPCFQALQTVSGSISHLFRLRGRGSRPSGVSHPPGVQLPGLASPGGGPTHTPEWALQAAAGVVPSSPSPRAPPTTSFPSG